MDLQRLWKLSQDPFEKVLKKIGVEAENAVGGAVSNGLNNALSPKNQIEFK